MGQIKKKDMLAITKWYSANMPGWKLLPPNSIYRTSAPFVHAVTLNNKPSGIYEVVIHFVTLAVPDATWAFEAKRLLPIRVRYIDAGNHDLLKERVLAEIKSQMVPRHDETFTASAAYEIYRATPGDSVREYYLAAAAADLGYRNEFAMHKDKYVADALRDWGSELPKSDIPRLEYLKELSLAFERGDVHRATQEMVAAAANKLKIDLD